MVIIPGSAFISILFDIRKYSGGSDLTIFMYFQVSSDRFWWLETWFFLDWNESSARKYMKIFRLAFYFNCFPFGLRAKKRKKRVVWNLYDMLVMVFAHYYLCYSSHGNKLPKQNRAPGRKKRNCHILYLVLFQVFFPMKPL